MPALSPCSTAAANALPSGCSSAGTHLLPALKGCRRDASTIAASDTRDDQQAQDAAPREADPSNYGEARRDGDVRARDVDLLESLGLPAFSLPGASAAIHSTQLSVGPGRLL
jgi:hypothetical protein